jgi:hypothetical protein
MQQALREYAGITFHQYKIQKENHMAGKKKTAPKSKKKKLKGGKKLGNSKLMFQYGGGGATG